MELKPIVPFEPIRVERVPSGPEWISQVKWDGVRMLVYYDGTNVKLWNRSGNDRTMQYPELADVGSYCRAGSVILDGELIALENGKPSFQQIMKRDQLRSDGKIRLALNRIPVSYMVFDVLYCDGNWCNNRPLSERQQLLERIVVPNGLVQLVSNAQDGEVLLGVMRGYGMEGIVCKDLTSLYPWGGKDRRWQKIKLFRDLYAVIGGVTFRDNIVNALLLGVYDERGALVYIGHAGSAKLTGADWERLTRRIETIRAEERPFANKPERSKDAIWVRPEIAVKVQFLNWTADGVMRHPTIQSLLDADHLELLCTTRQLSDTDG
ncbi:DNA ligase [Paenibacillus hodogayensis]|uniref:DNA ligase (ATP) n=1 Tax=Paenibacillus hodogayensis TaxID=279208 RepID=A0ABV5VS22_9BACL